MATARRDRASRSNARTARAAAKPSRLWRWIKRVGVGLVAVLVLGSLGLVGTLWAYGRDLPDVHALRDYRPPQVTRVLDRDGRVLGESFQERRTVVPLSRVPRPLVLCLLAAEDADFYRHQGLDYPGLVRALVRGVLSGGHFRGTSTITQQLVKNLLLTPERSLGRKIRELLLARRLEQEFSKDEILELYLNHVNFGHGRYGVQEAARFYFDKNVEDLSLAEASLIAGIPQSPTHLSPRTHPEAARRRQLFVLSQLEAKRAEYWPDLSAEDIRAAREVRVELAPAPERTQAAHEIVAYSQQLLREIVGEDAARRGGYTIHTTIDTDLQIAARRSLRGGLGALDERQHLRGPLHAPRTRRRLDPVAELAIGPTYEALVTGAHDGNGVIELDVGGHRAVARMEDLGRYNPDSLAATQFAETGSRVRVTIEQLPPPDDAAQPARARLELGPQGAIVVIDPRSRDVLALVGSFEEGPGFNRALMAVRQPGSTFKPLVYAAGLRHGYTPASIVIDAPGVYDDWRPSNYETWTFQGELRLREALAQSINQVAVRVLQGVGEDVARQQGRPIQPELPGEIARAMGLGAEAVSSLARDLGITTPLEPTPSLALGASDVKPIELVNAYATFAAGGRWAPARLVSRIVAPDGRDVPLPALAEPREVLTPAEAYVLTSMLGSVVERGTAQRARSLRRSAAGKTGTSNEARDAWFVGFTPEVVAGVWVGFDDRRSLGRRESGARSALPIWIDVVRSATEGRPAVAFPIPSGVVSARIDPRTGLLAYEGQADAIDEVFLEGRAPTERAPDPSTVDSNALLMEQMGGTAPAPEPGPAGTPP